MRLKINMKSKKRRLAAGLAAVGLMAAAVLGLNCYYRAALPDDFLVKQGEQAVSIASMPGLTLDAADAAEVKAGVVQQNSVSAQTAVVKLWGILPIKTVTLQPVQEKQLQIGGNLFGIKLYTDGVLVVELDKVTTASGRASPGKDAGLKVGDSILSANGVPISTNEELRDIIATGNGKAVELAIRRGESILQLSLQPVKSSGGVWRGGIWVRDSTAGIGTLTCFDEQTGAFAGLGHGIYDVDAGTLLSIGKGEICKAALTGIEKGKNGTPGQLEGVFTGGAPQGILLYNTECGIGGTLDARELMKEQECVSLPVGFKQEVTTGKAYLCSRLDGSAAELYEVEIEKVDFTPGKQSKNLVIRVTDERLLEQTGGIVQGMSGSPIIQNGKLIGAVTHVFVNDAAKGYGIFIENMLDAVSLS